MTTLLPAPPSPRPSTRPSPFLLLGQDIFERILSHLSNDSSTTGYLTTDGIRQILPFALACTAHYTLTTRSIRRLSVLPLHFTQLRRSTPSTPTDHLPFPAFLSPTYIPSPPPAAPSPRSFTSGKVSPRSFTSGKVSPLHLSRMLRVYPNLRYLHLSLAAFVTDAALSAVSQHLPDLRELRVPGNPHITVSGLSALAVRCRRLATLDLSYCKRLGDECAPVLRAMPNLKSLDVSYWKVSDAFVSVVAGAPRLEMLTLSACTRLTADACREVGRQAGRLERLRFRCAPGVRDEGVRELMNCGALRVVDLSLSRNLSDEGVAALGEADRLSCLEKVLLSQCRMVTDCGVRLLARNRNIRCLDLSFCDLLTDESATALKELPWLEELDLSGCRNLTDKAVEILAEFPSLVRLKLTHCHQLTDDSAVAISAAPNVPLQSVDVWKCYGITPVGLEKLRDSCTKLRC